jgi:hypothetical protein
MLRLAEIVDVLSMPRLRVRNHGAVVGAPVPPWVVPAFAALEMLLARAGKT